MFELNLSVIGWIHTFFSIVAMLAFVPVMLARKGNHPHRSWGRAYAIAYVAVCVTSLGIYSGQRFRFPHWLATHGVVMLVFVLLIGVYVTLSAVGRARSRPIGSVSHS